MLKKIILGIILFVVIAAAGLGLWIWSMHEAYPERDAAHFADVPDSPLPSELRAALGELLTDYRAEHHLPSISLAIGLDGDLVYAGAVGYADLEAERPATPRSLYRIGSVSKSITTVALGSMMEDGIIDIDRDFRDYVPDFPEKQWPFTLRQLASHTAGVRHYVSPMENYHDVHYASVGDALVLVADDRLLFEPGTLYRYSSYGFNMLSAAMAAAAGTPFMELLNARVFAPAGMVETLAENAPDPDPRTVGFYNQTKEWSFRAPYADNSYKIAGGGLIGTPSDLVRLGNALLAGDLLAPETWTELVTTTPLADGSTDHGYGLGIGAGEVQIGERTLLEIGHSGGSVGGITLWRLFPDVATANGTHDLVVAATMNISSLNSEARLQEVIYPAIQQVMDALDAGQVASAPRGTRAAPVADEDGWITLFDGETLDGWTPKVRGYPVGENPLDTFRVEDGKLVVSYENYEHFENRFGHIFYETPFSHYRLSLEYRFLGEPATGTEEWAYRNSGAMLHSQAPETMPPAQDFPISIEFQFLGGLVEGEHRATGNLCTPGTHVTLDGVFTEEHCIWSSSPTIYGDEWVTAEALVLGSDRVVHFINGEAVLEYTDPVTGGGVVSEHDPAMKPEGEPLGEGYISLQSEGHRIEFRNIRVRNLKGCMNPHAANYETWYVQDDPEACAF